jgi:hypothetical protein
MTVPVTFRPSNYGEKKDKVNGQIFINVEYIPRPDKMFYFEWRDRVHNIHVSNEHLINRYEHFNDLLSNEFQDTT